MIADVIIRTGESPATDIILYIPPDSSLAYPRPEQDTTIYLMANSLDFQLGGISGPAIESKLKRWTGTEWIAVGTLVVFK